MNKDEYQKFLDENIKIKLHKKFEAAETEGFIERIKKPEQCSDCNRSVDLAPIRTHRMSQYNHWLSYCKDCGKYKNAETGAYDVDYANAYRLLQKVSQKKSDSSN